MFHKTFPTVEKIHSFLEGFLNTTNEYKLVNFPAFKADAVSRAMIVILKNSIFHIISCHFLYHAQWTNIEHWNLTSWSEEWEFFNNQISSQLTLSELKSDFRKSSIIIRRWHRRFSPVLLSSNTTQHKNDWKWWKITFRMQVWSQPPPADTILLHMTMKFERFSRFSLNFLDTLKILVKILSRWPEKQTSLNKSKSSLNGIFMEFYLFQLRNSEFTCIFQSRVLREN